MHAEVSGHGRATIAARDIHVHYEGGGRATRRVESDRLVEECPYPGLAPFTAEQDQWFFGREALTAVLVGRLAERLDEGAPLVLVAPSGAGKSSLLRAGLLPAISRGVLPVIGSKDWPQLILTPTAHPMTAVARHLVALLGVEPGEVDVLVSDTDRLIEALRARLATQADTARVVMVVDQFEELFTLCMEEQERFAFLDLMARIAHVDVDGRSLGLVVYGLRMDAYAFCVGYPHLRAALQQGQVIVGPMSESELRQTILLPAREVGLDVEPGLVELLLRDLGAIGGDSNGYEASRLPLLAHALQATWQQRHGHTLTVEGYRNMGGIHDAVATTAERIFTRLNSADQQVTRGVFLRLVKIGEDIDDTRRTMAREDLLRESRDPDTVSAVLDAFTRGRLLTQEQDTVEITHEALLRAWPRLRTWIDEDRAGNLARQELEEAATTWERDQRDPAVLLRGSRLETARTWVDTSAHADDLSSVARAYFTASVRHDRRIRRRRRNIVILLCVLTLVASAAAGLAFQQRAKAQAERDKAQAERDNAILRQLSTKADQLRATDPSLAAKLALVAYRKRQIPDIYRDAPDLYMSLVAGTRTSLNDPDTSLNPSSEGIEGNVNAMAYSPDGRTLAVGVRDGRIRLWNVSDPTNPTPLALLTDGTKCPIDQGAIQSCVTSMAYSPDGRTLAIGGAGKIRLWNVADPTNPTPLTPLTDRAKCPTSTLPGEADDCVFSSVAFSPDGRTLVAIRGHNRILLWSVADPTRLRAELSVDSLMSFAFSPDSRTLVTGSAGKIRLWNVTDFAHPAVLSELTIPGEGYVPSIAFSPDGRTLAGGDILKLWNVVDPAHPTPLAELVGHPQGTMLVVFSPNRSILVSRGYADGIRLWNVTDSNHPSPLGKLYSSEFFDIAVFSPDGRTLATIGDTIGLWEMNVDHAIRAICVKHGNLTREEWKQYISDLPYNPACP
jgi:WD40 repeat protein